VASSVSALTGTPARNTAAHDFHDWTSESWSPTVANGLGSLQSSQSLLSYSEGSPASVDDISSTSSVMGHRIQSHEGHAHCQTHSGLDSVDGLMMPAHALDSLDENADFGFPDGSWIQQCVG
jgi:hypothetical protein